ncbi:MAG TPA: tetratricopeptide repeat protein [Thermoplasmata archaeon]|nr:tetratricopeptide repeat protein [Thermoplasmata archaeon]
MAELLCPNCKKQIERIANLGVCWHCSKGYGVRDGEVIAHSKAGGDAGIPIEYADLLKRHESLLAKDPDSVTLLFGKAILLSKMKLHDQAIEVFDQVIARQPTHKRVWVAKAEALHALGRREEAAAHYRKAVVAAQGRDPRREDVI